MELENERTSELTYLSTVVLNSFSPMRERLVMSVLPAGIDNKHISELAYLATVVLNFFSPTKEKLAMPAMPEE